MNKNIENLVDNIRLYGVRGGATNLMTKRYVIQYIRKILYELDF